MIEVHIMMYMRERGGVSAVARLEDAVRTVFKDRNVSGFMQAEPPAVIDHDFEGE